MIFKISVVFGLIAGATALPAVSQISDGQVQNPEVTATPVSQLSDGQVQAQTTGIAGVDSTAAASAASSPFVPYSYPEMPTPDLAAASSAAFYAGIPVSEIPGATNAIPPVVSSQVTGATSHGPYSGPPATTTGAVSNSPLSTAIPTLPPNPTALLYNPNGELNDAEVIPYQPAGGLGTNGTEPVYRVQSDFDYESVLLGLYQEWIELDLFHYILATFSEEEFTAAGLTPSDRFLIEFMADQETGHATLLSSLLGGPGGATPQCNFLHVFQTCRILIYHL